MVDDQDWSDDPGAVLPVDTELDDGDDLISSEDMDLYSGNDPEDADNPENW